MDDKYIELLVKRCTTLEVVPILFINYDKEIKPFVDRLVEFVKKMGVTDIYLDEEDPDYLHDLLLKLRFEEMINHAYFNKRIWDSYAKKGASFLIFETEYPHLMDDVPSSKVAVAHMLFKRSRPLFRRMQMMCSLSWCIASYPNIRWAKEIFPRDEDSYERLKSCIYQICMVDRDNPIKAWDDLVIRNEKIVEKLNSYQFVKLRYKNNLGTDLVIYLLDGYLYETGKDFVKGKSMLVNMPTYEVFTSPDYRKTEGIVYSSMPLNYGGEIVNEFFLKFHEGRVVEFGAKEGEETLKRILEGEERMDYLGEAALVETGSLIDRLGLVFGTTLIDENASCHLALGAGFPECLQRGMEMSDEELLNCGVNISKNHVDFMIGTSDLSIVGTTRDGREIPIFIDGKFSEDIL